MKQFAESTSECTQETDPNKHEQLKDDSFETFMACAFLQNGDSDKCGSLKKNFQTHCASNGDQCPKKAMGVSGAFQSHVGTKEKCKQKEESRQNESNDQDKESGTSLAQNMRT